MGVGISTSSAMDTYQEDTEPQRATPTLSVNDVDTEDSGIRLLEMNRMDPRSPSDGVPRTPTNFQKIASSLGRFDPRSPTMGISRSPIPANDIIAYPSAFDPRSPTHNFRRTPILRPQQAQIQLLLDPRSPTIGISRTPIETMLSASAVDSTVVMAAATLQNLIDCDLAPEEDIDYDDSNYEDFDIEVGSFSEMASQADADIDDMSIMNVDELDFELENTTATSTSTEAEMKMPTWSLNSANVESMEASTVDMVKKFIDTLDKNDPMSSKESQQSQSENIGPSENQFRRFSIDMNVKEMPSRRMSMEGGGQCSRRMSTDSCLSTTSIDSTSRRILGQISTNSPTKRLSMSMMASPSKSHRNSLASPPRSRKESLVFFGSSPARKESMLSLPIIPSSSMFSTYIQDVTGTEV
eukprot:m.70645 g.70645  ORF g.70645 m.70645 type:complete len:411 (-) comp24252_c0_seq1:31-1263(-)